MSEPASAEGAADVTGAIGAIGGAIGAADTAGVARAEDATDATDARTVGPDPHPPHAITAAVTATHCVTDIAQISDSVRMLAPALHDSIDQLLAHFSSTAKGDLRARTRDAEMADIEAHLAALIHGLDIAGAQCAVRVLVGWRTLLRACAAQSATDALQLSAAQADIAVDALWRLHDYLDGLHDKSGDTDIFDWLLFAPWRRLTLLHQPEAEALLAGAARAAPGWSQALAQLKEADGFETMLAPLRSMAEILQAAAANADAGWQVHAHGFMLRLLDGRQALDHHALALLEQLVRQLAPSGSAPGAAALIARISLLVNLADEQVHHWRRAANESQLMVRLMLQADEMQQAWDRCMGTIPGPERRSLAWQWQDSLIRTAATARRLWPRLRGVGMSGFLSSLARLGPELAMGADQERRDREVSSCLILLEEALRRRFYLQEDSLRQGDCIVDYLAHMVRGGGGADDFPWFSRELRGDLTRRMEGVAEGDILRKLREVELTLDALWHPAEALLHAEDVHEARAMTQALVTRIHDELSQIDGLSSCLHSSELHQLGQALRQQVGERLLSTLDGEAGDAGGESGRQRDSARAAMVRDLARVGQMLEQALRSPPNRWRRLRASAADGLRQALERDDSDGMPGASALPEMTGVAAMQMPAGDFMSDPPGMLQPAQHDPEMIEIFLAEAWQLLEGLRTQLPLLAAGPASLEQMQSLRRCFHTLKGSGRMVGLQALSDAAQAVEMVVNACLAASRASGVPCLPVAVQQLLDGATLLLATWIDELAAAGRCARHAPTLIATALRLRAELAGQLRDDEAPEEVVEVAEVVAVQAASATQDAAVAVTESAAACAVLDPHLRTVYLAEAKQLFKTLRQQGSSWRAKANSGLVAGPPPLLVRAVHTLRGCSGAAGFAGLHEMASALEHLLEHLKRSGMGLDAHALTVVEAAVAAMQDMQDRYAAGSAPGADITALAAIAELAASLGPSAVAATPGGLPLGPAASPPPSAASAPSAPAPAAVPTLTAPVVPATPANPPTADSPVQLRDEIDLDLLPLFLEEGHDLLAAVGQGLHHYQRTPAESAVLSELLRALHTVKGSARMAGALQLGQCMHELESAIQRVLRSDGGALGGDGLLALYDRALRQFEALEQLGVLPPAEARMQPLSESERRLASPLVRIQVSVLDHLLNQVGEVSIARSQLENEVDALKRTASELADNVAKLSTQLRDVEIQAEIQMSASSQASPDSAQFDPLELDRFTHLHELTRMMAESVNDVASLQKQLAESAGSTHNRLLRQGRIMRELQQELMHTRMVKFSSLEARLQHLVWQLNRETGKALSLEIEGGDVGLDRGILEKMIAPFEHLLRNAAVHGIEGREERAAAGKALAGCLRIQATQEGSEATIRISDDGGGLDLDAIRTKALAVGLLAEGEQAEDERVSELIFEPGFTTSEQVSALAGRGVGMDVVRSEVTALGGRITVHSLPGAGASFTVHLPLSLAVKQVCLLRQGAQSYAIPSTLVDKVVQLRGEQMRQALAEGTLGQGLRKVALHALSSLLDEPRVDGELPPVSVYVLFVKSGNELVAIMVDHVSGNREVVAKPVGPQLGGLVGVVGATVLGNGEIALIINPLLLARRIGYRRLQNARHEVPGSGRKIVMVVDDSLTVRRVMQRLLVREGFAVVLATDGYDAIRQLHEVTPDVFLVDIEMPRMDGFTLVRHLRDNEATSTRPIIMITSRTGAKHRERAMEVGVNYYLGKPYQDQQLLFLIRHYTRELQGHDDFSDVLY